MRTVIAVLYLPGLVAFELGAVWLVFWLLGSSIQWSARLATSLAIGSLFGWLIYTLFIIRIIVFIKRQERKGASK